MKKMGFKERDGCGAGGDGVRTIMSLCCESILVTADAMAASQLCEYGMQESSAVRKAVSWLGELAGGLRLTSGDNSRESAGRYITNPHPTKSGNLEIEFDAPDINLLKCSP